MRADHRPWNLETSNDPPRVHQPSRHPANMVIRPEIHQRVMELWRRARVFRSNEGLDQDGRSLEPKNVRRRERHHIGKWKTGRKHRRKYVVAPLSRIEFRGHAG